MKTKILSIIIPIYNSSKYLKRCIDSILNQGLKDGTYEIILVNDGSTDDSLTICEEYQQKYGEQLIKVVNQSNQGVSAARNNGLKVAEGDYVNFIDSDDYLIPGGLAYLIRTHLSPTVDILTYWSKTLDRNTYKHFKETYQVEGKVYFDNDGFAFLSENVQTSVVTSIYRRDFLLKHQLEFDSLCIGEDVLFNLKTYLKNPKLRSVSSRLYRYDLHPESAIHNRNFKFTRKGLESYLCIFSFLIDNIHKYQESNVKLSLGLRRILEGQFVPFVSRLLSSDLSVHEISVLRKDLLEKEILPLKNSTKENRIFNFIFNFYPFIKVYQFLFRHLFLPYVFPRLNRN